jgi:hypothetical protein
MSAYVHPEYHHHLHAIALSYAMYLDIYPKAKTTKMFASDPSLGSVSKQNQPRMQVFFLLPSKSPPEDAFGHYHEKETWTSPINVHVVPRSTYSLLFQIAFGLVTFEMWSST